jgi:hypothetical protein
MGVVSFGKFWMKRILFGGAASSCGTLPWREASFPCIKVEKDTQLDDHKTQKELSIWLQVPKNPIIQFRYHCKLFKVSSLREIPCSLEDSLKLLS